MKSQISSENTSDQIPDAIEGVGNVYKEHFNLLIDENKVL